MKLASLRFSAHGDAPVLPNYKLEKFRLNGCSHSPELGGNGWLKKPDGEDVFVITGRPVADYDAVVKALGKNLPAGHTVLEVSQRAYDAIPNPAH